jgi:hypothetical protein
VSTRTLFRAVYDATLERTGVQEDPAYADDVRRSAAGLMAELATVVHAFGRLLCAEIETSGEAEEADLTAALAALRRERAGVEELLLADPRGRKGLWELNSAILTTADRVLHELDDAEHARLRTAQQEAERARRSTSQAVGRLRSTTRQLGERVDLIKRVDLNKRADLAARQGRTGGRATPRPADDTAANAGRRDATRA